MTPARPARAWTVDTVVGGPPGIPPGAPDLSSARRHFYCSVKQARPGPLTPALCLTDRPRGLAGLAGLAPLLRCPAMPTCKNGLPASCTMYVPAMCYELRGFLQKRGLYVAAYPSLAPCRNASASADGAPRRTLQRARKAGVSSLESPGLACPGSSPPSRLRHPRRGTPRVNAPPRPALASGHRRHSVARCGALLET